MKEAPLISVVVPIYNVEKYIKKSIESIINQKYKNLEIILVNDGSPDNCGKIIEEYAKIDKRIKIIHKQNGGLSDARNAGMKEATGDFICFLDSDDYIELNLFSDILKKEDILENDVIVWGFYVDFMDEEENVKKVLERRINNSSNKIENISPELLNILGYAWNKLYKLSFLKNNNYEFEKGLSRIEDTEFNSRVLKEAKVYLNKGVYNHYIQRNRETLGIKKYDNQYELDNRFVKSHIDLLKNWNIEEEQIKNILDHDYYSFFRRDLRNIVKNKNTCYSEKQKEIEELLNRKNNMKIYEDDFCIKGFKFNIIKILAKYKMIHLLQILSK